MSAYNALKSIRQRMVASDTFDSIQTVSAYPVSKTPAIAQNIKSKNYIIQIGNASKKNPGSWFILQNFLFVTV